MVLFFFCFIITLNVEIFAQEYVKTQFDIIDYFYILRILVYKL